MKQIYILGLLLCFAMGVFSQDLQDSLRIYHEISSTRIDTLFMRNGESLSSFFNRNLVRFNNPRYQLKKVLVVGSASPDGRLAYNESLALERAQSLSNYIKAHLPLEEQLMEVVSVGVDWRTLTELVLEASELPYQNEVLDILQGEYLHQERLGRLKHLKGGASYRWMLKHLFPLLRYSQVMVYYDVQEAPAKPEPVQIETVPVVVKDTVVEETSQVTEPVKEKKPFYWALKTNALYDLALIPNVGVEFSFNKQWSVAANWMYAWWSNRGKNNFWRVYGGDVEVRRWLGRKAEEKPLQGHHIGIYGQLLTYDFELGGRGYLADKWNYAFGISYGYSLPIARRLNLDFNLGIGYWGGRYKEYEPIEGHYVWQATKNRRWIGPTKAEVSLVWLLGYGNENKQKGGRR